MLPESFPHRCTDALGIHFYTVMDFPTTLEIVNKKQYCLPPICCTTRGLRIWSSRDGCFQLHAPRWTKATSWLQPLFLMWGNLGHINICNHLTLCKQLGDEKPCTTLWEIHFEFKFQFITFVDPKFHLDGRGQWKGERYTIFIYFCFNKNMY